MTDITADFSNALAVHDARLAEPAKALECLDEFLKEAYRIHAHVASLHRYLRSIRQSYLSTTSSRRQARHETSSARRSNRAAAGTGVGSNSTSQPLTDAQRDTIDSETKQVLRELNASIRNLADAEQLRQDTAATLLRKKYGRLGLSALGAWALGGDQASSGTSSSWEQQQDEARERALSTHREAVLWYLRQKLQECGSAQGAMMETRITREMEKNKSVLYKTRGQMMMPAAESSIAPAPSSSAIELSREAPEEKAFEQELTQEQIQMFEQDNQDMLKQYEATLDQVRTAEKSLVEISELQTQLVNNLTMQAEHIDVLVTDSQATAANVGGGNKELTKATRRPSTAKYIFYASCGLSAFLVVYDLLI